MAELTRYEELIQRHDDALMNVIDDIEDLKEQVGELGLTVAQENQLYNALESMVMKVEALALDNPEAPSPENPLPEQEI